MVGISSGIWTRLVGKIPSLNVVGKSVFAGMETAASMSPRPMVNNCGMGAEIDPGKWLKARSAAATKRIEEGYMMRVVLVTCALLVAKDASWLDLQEMV